MINFSIRMIDSPTPGHRGDWLRSEEILLEIWMVVKNLRLAKRCWHEMANLTGKIYLHIFTNVRYY